MTHENRDYIEVLRAKGYRVTPQRLIVLDAICTVDGHASAGHIVEQVNLFDNTINRSTIYRALDVLVEVGLVTETEIGDEGKVYRIADTAGHHHLVCKLCDTVITIDSDSFDGVFQHLLEIYGFAVLADHMALSGICESCRQQSDKSQ